MEIIGYIAAIFMGVTLGVLGGGGSILTVPILVYLFSLTASTATTYSLFVVGLTAAIGSVTYMRQGLINYKVAALFAGPSLIGVYLARALLLPALPENFGSLNGLNLSKDLLLMLLFAVLMVLASNAMIRGQQPAQVKTSDKMSGHYSMAMRGLSVGLITGFIGAGGGFLIIPALVILAGLNMKNAVGTSLLIIAVNSLIGFFSHLNFDASIDWTFLFAFTALAVVGIVLGSFASGRVPDKSLKVLFGWFILVMGSIIIIQQLFSPVS